MKPVAAPTTPASSGRPGSRRGRPATAARGPDPALPSGGGPGAGALRPAPSDQPDCSPDEERADHQEPAALGQLELPEPRVRLDRLPHRVAVAGQPVVEGVRALRVLDAGRDQAVDGGRADLLAVGCLDPAADDPAGPGALTPAWFGDRGLVVR